MNRRAPGSVSVTPTEAATTATASASQAQTVCMPQTQFPPVTSAFVPLSVGRGVPSAFNIINAADFDVATSFRSGRFFPPVCHGLPMPTLPLPIRGCMGLSLTCGHPTTPSPTPPPLAGLAWLPRARLQPPPSYPPPCPSTSHRPTTAQLRRRCSLRMSATRSQRRDRPTIPSNIYPLFVTFVCLERG